jgi:hypothetical protein
MKRRLTLARALINDPDIIFLDEPTTGLDPQARHLIWERLKRLMVGGKTLILTTHFMDEAERLCDRLAILDHGVLIAEGAPRELIASHIEPQVVEIFGEGAAAWAAIRQGLGERLEMAGDTAFFYCRDAAPLLAALAGETGPASLAVRASRGQPRGCLPQADRARPPGLGSCATGGLPCPAPACAGCRCGGATSWSGASWPSPRSWATSPTR